MGGTKKALLHYEGRCFYEQIAYAMREAGVEKLFASVEKSWETELGMPQIVDRYQRIGPLGGIVTAMETLKEAQQGILVVPCDLPFISPVLLKRLIEAHAETSLPVVVVQEGRVNPLVAVYTRDCLPVLHQQIEAKNYRATFWTRQVIHKEIVFETLGLEQRVLVNVNTKEAYRQII